MNLRKGHDDLPGFADLVARPVGFAAEGKDRAAFAAFAAELCGCQADAPRQWNFELNHTRHSERKRLRPHFDPWSFQEFHCTRWEANQPDSVPK